MIYLLDTNALRDLINQHPRFDSRFRAIAPPDRVAVTTIVCGEAWFGVELLPAGKRRDAVAANVRQALGTLAAEPVPAAAAEHYAAIKRARVRESFCRWMRMIFGSPRQQSRSTPF